MKVRHNDFGQSFFLFVMGRTADLSRNALYYEDERNSRPVEEFRKNPEFRKAYNEEVARLQIGYKIANLRQMRQLSQAELARKVNTTQQTISRLEDLRNARINIKTLARLAAALRARLSIDFVPRELSA